MRQVVFTHAIVRENEHGIWHARFPEDPAVLGAGKTPREAWEQLAESFIEGRSVEPRVIELYVLPYEEPISEYEMLGVALLGLLFIGFVILLIGALIDSL